MSRKTTAVAAGKQDRFTVPEGYALVPVNATRGMKKAGNHTSRPSHHIQRIEEDFPGIWRRIEKNAKHATRAPWMIKIDPDADISKVLPPVYPPHPFAEPFYNVIAALSEEQADEVRRSLKMTGNSENHRLVSYPHEWMECLYAWRAFKLIYAFDTDFWEEIHQTPLEGAPNTDIFNRLPADTFYMGDGSKLVGSDIDHDSFDEGSGFFVKKNDNKLTIALNRVQFITFDIGQWTFNDELERLAKRTEKTRTRLMINQAQTLKLPQIALESMISKIEAGEGARIEKLRKEITELWGGRLSALMYLCAQEPDIDGVLPPSAKVSRLGSRIHVSDAKQEYVSKVGYRIGAVFRHAKRSAKNNDESGVLETGQKVMPHVRRAHWHTYWVGPRTDPTPSLRWIAPVMVNAQFPDDLLDVIHPVEKDEVRLKRPVF